jgi:hypothetical protein
MRILAGEINEGVPLGTARDSDNHPFNRCFLPDVLSGQPESAGFVGEPGLSLFQTSSIATSS